MPHVTIFGKMLGSLLHLVQWMKGGYRERGRMQRPKKVRFALEDPF